MTYFLIIYSRGMKSSRDICNGNGRLIFFIARQSLENHHSTKHLHLKTRILHKNYTTWPHRPFYCGPLKPFTSALTKGSFLHNFAVPYTLILQSVRKVLMAALVWQSRCTSQYYVYVTLIIFLLESFCGFLDYSKLSE